MASELLKVTVFVIVFHSLVFFAGQSPFMQGQQGDNPHETFVEQFLTGQFSDTVEIDQSSGIISGTVSLAARALDFIGFMVGIVVSPQLLIIQSPLPTEFKTLFGALLGFMEIAAIAYFIRGIS